MWGVDAGFGWRHVATGERGFAARIAHAAQHVNGFCRGARDSASLDDLII
jgi:hypothetical protein